MTRRGWSGGEKVSCISRHMGVRLILAYSWARPAILVAGKDTGGNVFISSVSSLSFLFLFLPCPSLSSLLLSLLSLFPLSVGDDTKWPTRVEVSLNPNTINCMTRMLWQTTYHVIPEWFSSSVCPSCTEVETVRSEKRHIIVTVLQHK